MFNPPSEALNDATVSPQIKKDIIARQDRAALVSLADSYYAKGVDNLTDSEVVKLTSTLVTLGYDAPEVKTYYDMEKTEIENSSGVSKEFRRIMQEENNHKQKDGGWDSTTERWKPHTSLEGGTKTLAYGHKLDTTEIANNMVYGIDITNGITEADAEYIFKQDAKEVLTSLDIAESTDENIKTAIIDVFFRLGPNGKAPSFVKAIKEGDYSEAYVQTADISFTDTSGTMRYYNDRNKRIFEQIGLTITPEIQSRYDALQQASIARHTPAPKPAAPTDTQVASVVPPTKPTSKATKVISKISKK